MDKTFAAIEKLKEVELELHRLKNALEMMNKAHEAKREWQDLTDDESDEIWGECLGVFDCLRMTQAKLKEKNA